MCTGKCAWNVAMPDALSRSDCLLPIMAWHEGFGDMGAIPCKWSIWWKFWERLWICFGMVVPFISCQEVSCMFFDSTTKCYLWHNEPILLEISVITVSLIIGMFRKLLTTIDTTWYNLLKKTALSHHHGNTTLSPLVPRPSAQRVRSRVSKGWSSLRSTVPGSQTSTRIERRWSNWLSKNHQF